MRWLIAAVAFLTPILIAVHLVLAGQGDPTVPAIGSAGLAELRDWLGRNHDIIEHYAPRPGQAESTGMPHVALDRFERSGCDPGGNPWYRLGDRPPGVACGLVRKIDPDRPVAPEGRRDHLLLLRVSGDWLYWERRTDGTASAGP